MSLIITCEVGGNELPSWFDPQLHLPSKARRGRKKKRTSSRHSGKHPSNQNPSNQSGNSVKTKSARRSNAATSAQTNKLQENGSEDYQPELRTDHELTITTDVAASTFSTPPLNTPKRKTSLARKRFQINHDRYPSPLQQLPKSTKVDDSAREIADHMAHQLDAASIMHQHPIELIDVTKDQNQRNLISGPFKSVTSETQLRLLSEIHQPYFEQVCSGVDSLLQQNGYVIHLSVKTFPLLRNKNRLRTDVGLLYDTTSQDEVDLSMDWIDDLWYRAPMLKVRRNYPRRGAEIGITRRLRREFKGKDYVGLELWLNRAWAARRVSLREEALDAMTESLGAVTGLSESAMPYQEAA